MQNHNLDPTLECWNIDLNQDWRNNKKKQTIEGSKSNNLNQNEKKKQKKKRPNLTLESTAKK